jgi:hypothetical protein
MGCGMAPTSDSRSFSTLELKPPRLVDDRFWFSFWFVDSFGDWPFAAEGAELF